MWKINYSPLCSSTLKMLKTITFGEYMKDLEIGAKISSLLGIEKAPEGESDEKELDSGSPLDNIGVTLILVSLILVLLMSCCVCCIYCAKKYSMNPSVQKCFTKVKEKMFFNPVIRMTLLNHLKFVLVAVTAYYKQ